MPSRLHTWLLLLALLLLIPPASTLAQSLDQLLELSIEELMRVEITTSASHLPTRRQQAPATVYTFDREDFSRLGIRRVEQLFTFIPGFQLNQYRKRHTTLWARGLVARHNNKMVLLIDGIPRKQIYYGHFSLGNALPLELIERVEVILGPASSLYGANALGGVISITTRPHDPQKPHALTLELADNQHYQTEVLLTTPATRLFASHLTQQAPFSADRRAFTGDPTRQPLGETFSTLHLHHRLNPQLALSLELRHNETPFLFIPPTQDAWVEEQALSAALHYHHGEPQQGQWNGQLFYLRDHSEEREAEALSQQLGYHERQHADLFGADLRYTRQLHPDHTLLLAGEWRQERAKDLALTRHFHFRDGFLDPPRQGYLINNPNFREDNLALLLQEVWRLDDDLTLTLGGRYDRYNRFGEHLNYRTALSYTSTPQHTWNLLYGTAIRTPSYRESMKILDDKEFQPPPLHPERIATAELAYHYQREDTALGITLFHNTLQRYIREVPVPGGDDQYFANSHHDWQMQGLELLLEQQLNEALHLRLGASYLDPQWDLPGRPPYLSRYTLHSALHYRYHPNHQLGASLHYIDQRQDSNRFPHDTPRAALRINLHVSGTPMPHLDYQLGIDNLFDQRIYDPAADFGWMHNTEQSRREIWARLRWHFTR